MALNLALHGAQAFEVTKRDLDISGGQSPAHFQTSVGCSVSVSYEHFFF